MSSGTSGRLRPLFDTRSFGRSSSSAAAIARRAAARAGAGAALAAAAAAAAASRPLYAAPERLLWLRTFA
jgi:hypothetical protein